MAYKKCHNGRAMSVSQLRAIWYAERDKKREKMEKMVIEKEGSLDKYRASMCKTLSGYVRRRTAEGWRQ